MVEPQSIEAGFRDLGDFDRFKAYVWDFVRGQD